MNTPATTTPESKDSRSTKKSTKTLPIAIGVAVVVALLLAAALTRTPARAPEAAPAAGSTPSASAAAEDPAKVALRALARRDPNDPLAIGRVDAPVVMIEYSDFRCPFCGVFARKTKPELMRYVDNGTLRIEYRDMPMFGEQSTNAAIAGRAAGAQGRFWEFFDAVYGEAPEKGRANLTPEELRRLAGKAGVPDLDAFSRALESRQGADKVDADLREGYRIGVSATPAFLINEYPLIGAQPTEAFVQTVERAAK